MMGMIPVDKQAVADEFGIPIEQITDEMIRELFTHGLEEGEEVE